MEAEQNSLSTFWLTQTVKLNSITENVNPESSGILWGRTVGILTNTRKNLYLVIRDNATIQFSLLCVIMSIYKEKPWTMNKLHSGEIF